MSARYAIYYTPPPDGAFARFGMQWLGRDPFTGDAVAQPHMTGADLAEATAFPRTYGFHATLKAPFTLASGEDEAGLLTALERFAAATAPAQGPPLMLAELSGFLALVPNGPAPAIDALASQVVTAFDRFRAPLTETERGRRRPERLSPRQRALLERWGYPWVHEAFWFHLTLTGRLGDPAVRDVLWSALTRETGPFCQRPFDIDGVAVFRQADPTAPFCVCRYQPLNGAS